MVIGWRNVWSREFQTKRKTKEDLERVCGKDCQARKLNKEDAVDPSRWRKLIKDDRWSGWVWVGECSFWYQPTQVVPGKGPLNGCVFAAELSDGQSNDASGRERHYNDVER